MGLFEVLLHPKALDMLRYAVKRLTLLVRLSQTDLCSNATLLASAQSTSGLFGRAGKFFWYVLFIFLTLAFFTFYGMMTVSLVPNIQASSVQSMLHLLLPSASDIALSFHFLRTPPLLLMHFEGDLRKLEVATRSDWKRCCRWLQSCHLPSMQCSSFSPVSLYRSR